MSPSRLAVRRPIAAAMLFIAITTVGAFSMGRLRVDLFPSLDFPSISVVVNYAGVSPEEMETLVARPIEAAVAGVDNLVRVETYSMEGRARVALRFDWGVDLETAANDVRAAVDRLSSVLPEDADAPVVWKFDLSNFPVMDLVLSGNFDEGRMRRFAEDIVGPRLEGVAGVAAVTVSGVRDRRIHIEMNPERLAALGLRPADVISGLRSENLTVPAGRVEQGDNNILIRSMGDFRSIEEIRGATVARVDGRPVLVRDIAEVRDGFDEIFNRVRIDGEPALRLRINKSPDANAIEVADRLYEEIRNFNRDNEGRASLTVQRDNTTFIRASITGIQKSVLLGAGLALIVLLVFLQSFRSTFVIGVAIPISVIGTFALMYRLDVTLNLISFGGLALGIGMLVDNAIVILENIHRHHAVLGKNPTDAAIEGAEEVAGAVVASTLTTAVVFLPVMFIGGFAAVFFREMAIVVTSALFTSLFVAILLVPALAAQMLRFPSGSDLLGRVFDRDGTRGVNPIQRLLEAMERLYGGFVRTAMRFWWLVLTLAVGALVVAGWQWKKVGKELLPDEDQSAVGIRAQFPPGTRIERTEAAVARIEQLIAENTPESLTVATTVGTPGFWSSDGEEFAYIEMVLVPVDERERSSEDIANALRPQLMTAVPGMRVFSFPSGGLWILRFLRGGEDRIRIEVLGHDLETADSLAAAVVGVLGEIDGVTDAMASRRPGGAERLLYVDRQRAADAGVTTREVAELISTLVQGTRAGLYREDGNEYDIEVGLSEAARADFDSLLDTPIALDGGRSVRLSSLVQVESGRTPKVIERLNRERIVIVSAGLDGSRDLGSINDEIRERLGELSVPDNFALRVAGEGEYQQENFQNLGMGIVLALLLVFMVMAAQFESLTHPILIMFSVPFGAVGVVGVLLATDTTFNLNSFMGVVVLVGVAVNNAIVMIDYANRLRRSESVTYRQAAALAAERRLRPILMTTATTVLALLPVAIGAGTGGSSQAAMARVIVGGMVSSTIVTLVLVPLIYGVVGGLFERREPGVAESPAGI